MDKKWAAVFDFDGTLISKSYGSLYDVIDSNGGVTPESHNKAVKMRNYYLALMHAGRLSPKHQEKWLMDSLDLYIKSRLTISKMREILSRVELRPGVKDCFLQLKARGIPVAVISYGVYQFIEEVLRRHDLMYLVDEIYSAHLKINSRGRVIGFRKETFIFSFSKGTYSREFADKHEVPHDNILAVGDSSGDRELGHLKIHRLGIAESEEEKERLLSIAGKVLITKDFNPATDWLLDKIDSE